MRAASGTTWSTSSRSRTATTGASPSGSTTYWALTREQLNGLVTEAGFDAPAWREPEESSFFQRLLTARVP
jgi:hypothetical protein